MITVKSFSSSHIDIEVNEGEGMNCGVLLDSMVHL